MPQLNWTEGNIAQAEITPGTKGFSARVEARSAESLTRLQTLLSQQQIPSFLDTADDKTTLVIPQLKNETLLLNTLQTSGMVSGTPTRTQIPADNLKKQSFIQKHPAKIAGVMLYIGGLAFIGSGIQRARHNRDGKFTKNDLSEMNVGIVWVFSNLLLALFGEKKTKDATLAYSDALDEHLKQRGAEVPLSEAVQETPQKQTAQTGAIRGFLDKHAVQIVALLKMTGGAFLVHSGSKKDNVNIRKMAGGSIFATGWLATLLFDNKQALPYKFKGEEEAKQNPGPASKALNWVKENPRRHITAPFASTHNLVTLWGALVERGKMRAALKAATTADDIKYFQRKQNDYLWNVGSEICYIIGNFFFGMSGKKAATQDMDKFSQDMMMVSANKVANMSEDSHAYAIEESAGYMASIQGITASKEELARQISHRVARLKKDYSQNMPGPSLTR